MKYLLSLLILPLLMGAKASVTVNCDAFSWTFANGNLSVNCSSPTTPADPTPTTQDPIQDPVLDPVTPGIVGANCIIQDISWPAGISVTGPRQHLGHNQMAAYRVVMPRRTGVVRSQIMYTDVPRYMSLSKKPCEFTQSLEDAYCGGVYSGYGAKSPVVDNQTAANPLNRPLCITTEGATYYFNVMNASSLHGQDTCPQGQPCYFYLSW